MSETPLARPLPDDPVCSAVSARWPRSRLAGVARTHADQRLLRSEHPNARTQSGAAAQPGVVRADDRRHQHCCLVTPAALPQALPLSTDTSSLGAAPHSVTRVAPGHRRSRARAC
jgi:hypothetical protein